jgi:hypothetical protein
MAVQAGNLVVGNATVVIGTDVGAIKEGITVTPTFSVFNVDIEQELMPSRFWYTDKKFQLEFTMCEPTLANVKYSWDVSSSITGGTPPNPFVMTFGTAAGTDFVPAARTIVCTSFVPGGAGGNLFTRTVIFNKCLLETPGPTVFSKRGETNLKCTFNCAIQSGSVGLFSDATT